MVVYGAVTLVHVVFDDGEGECGEGGVHGLDADFEKCAHGRHLLRLVAFKDGLLLAKIGKGSLPRLGWQVAFGGAGGEVGCRFLERVDAQAAVPKGEQFVHASCGKRVGKRFEGDASFGEGDDAFPLKRVGAPILGNILGEVGDFAYEGG